MNCYQLWRYRQCGICPLFGHQQADFWSRHYAIEPCSSETPSTSDEFGRKFLLCPKVTRKCKEQLLNKTVQHLPCLLKENSIKLGQCNKVFASCWLSNNKIILGTKCNKLLCLDLTKNSLTQLPLLPSSYQTHQCDYSAGIHAIAVNPSSTLLATGAINPSDISVYRLPDFTPVTVGEASHSDWIFALEWLDDEFLLSGSRDGGIGLWHFTMSQADQVECGHVPWVKCGSYNLPCSRALKVKHMYEIDKVRALAYNQKLKVVTSVSLNSYLHVLDMKTFEQVHLRRLGTSFTECVCICQSPEDLSFVLGSRKRVTFFDARSVETVLDIPLPSTPQLAIDQPYHNMMSSFPVPTGARSLSWSGWQVTVGTGDGSILFFDVRANKWLHCGCGTSAQLAASKGWVFRDELFDDVFINAQVPTAIYTHCYDQSRMRLFAAGGPNVANVTGNYAAMWC